MGLNLGGRECGDSLPALMFAEEGQANQGSFKFALKMIEVARNAGADGIEFQLGLADDLYVKGEPGHKIYLQRQFSSGQIRNIIESAKSKGLIFQAACLSPRLIELCARSGADSFCINAMDINNPQMLDAIAGSGRPFWLATLMCTIGEIDWAVNHLRSRGAYNFGILHGQHIMSSKKGAAVPPELTQLSCIKTFKDKYGLPVGFVDHTSSIYTPAIAAAKGADIVMKHLSPRQNWRGPDWQVCLSPKKWKEGRDILRYAVLTLGDSKELSEAELDDRKPHRRSLFTSRPLNAGQVLAEIDLVALRPGDGMEPKDITLLIGRKVKYPLKVYHKININDVER
jgi:sialic acid synthase SpsE